jgi:phosphoribosylformylglycinamidine synthase
MAEMLESPSLFFAGVAGARLPIAVAHGEGSVQPERQRRQPDGGHDSRRALHRDDVAPGRAFRHVQMSWNGGDVNELSPWVVLNFYHSR